MNPTAVDPKVVPSNLAGTPRINESLVNVMSRQNVAYGVEIPDADSIPVVDADEGVVQAAAYSKGDFVPKPKGRVLIVRGIMTVFSLGLNDVGKQLRERGCEVEISTAARSVTEARRMRERVIAAGDSAPVVIMGHSLGADRAPSLAAVFAEKNVPVNLLVLLDSTMPKSPPANVRRCVNYFQSKAKARIFQGKRIRASSTITEIVNVDIAELAQQQTTDEINHFNIDTNPWIQKLLVDTVEKGIRIASAQHREQDVDQAVGDNVYRFSDDSFDTRTAAVEMNLKDGGLSKETKSKIKRWR